MAGNLGVGVPTGRFCKPLAASGGPFGPPLTDRVDDSRFRRGTAGCFGPNLADSVTRLWPPGARAGRKQLTELASTEKSGGAPAKTRTVDSIRRQITPHANYKDISPRTKNARLPSSTKPTTVLAVPLSPNMPQKATDSRCLRSCLKFGWVVFGPGSPPMLAPGGTGGVDSKPILVRGPGKGSSGLATTAKLIAFRHSLILRPMPPRPLAFPRLVLEDGRRDYFVLCDCSTCSCG